jgi:hypothetical protein
MRAFPTVIAAIFVAGCATAPAGERIAVYDHKSNTTHYVYRSAQSEFVGTSAKTQNPAKAKPAWYAFGHP